MSKSFEPDSKIEVLTRTKGWQESEETRAEVVLGPLTAEVLRDIARNEAVQRSWRKAAIRFLVERNHKFQHHPEFKEFRDELADEANAETEVQALVESAIEGPLGE